MENENDDDKPTIYEVCPIAGIGHPMGNWPHCMGEKCAWFESTNQVCALTCIAFYAS